MVGYLAYLDYTVYVEVEMEAVRSLDDDLLRITISV